MLTHCRLRQVDVKAEHFERQVQRAEQERDAMEKKYEVRSVPLTLRPTSVLVLLCSPTHQCCLPFTGSTGEVPSLESRARRTRPDHGPDLLIAPHLVPLSPAPFQQASPHPRPRIMYMSHHTSSLTYLFYPIRTCSVRSSCISLTLPSHLTPPSIPIVLHSL